MEAISSGVCQAVEEEKESEDGHGGCVVGGGVGSRRQGWRSVRESEGEWHCRRTMDNGEDGDGSVAWAARV